MNQNVDYKHIDRHSKDIVNSQVEIDLQSSHKDTSHDQYSPH